MAEAVGAASVGLSAKGNAYNMALAQGYTKEQAQIYSTLIGASEAGLQYALGGISDLGGKLTNKAVQRTIANIDNSLLRLSADLGLKALGEGSEEYIQELLDPVFRNIAFQEGNELSLISEEGMYSFLLAVFTTGVLEFKNSYHDNVTLKKSGNQFIAAGLTQDVIDAGLKLKEGSAGRQLAEQLASGVYDSNGANIGQLADIYAKETGDNSLGKKLSEQSDKLGEIVQKADQLEVRQQKNDAQANLKPFSEHEAKNLLSSAKNKVVGFGATIQSFVQEAISSKGQKGGRLYVGKLSNHTVEIVRNATGIDVSGFSSIINSSEVWHAFKHHSDKKIEDQRGQVAITEEDFKLLPGILSDPDRVELSTDSDGFGRPALFFTKVIGDEYITVQGYSDKRKGLFFDSMWIKKDASRHASLLENNPPRGQRPKRSAGTASVEASASDISISSSGEKVNAKTGEQSAAQAKDLAKDQTIDQGAEFAANLEELRRLAKEMGLEVVGSEGAGGQKTDTTQVAEQSAEFAANMEELYRLAKEMGLEVVGSEKTGGAKADTTQPVQRQAWEDLSPETQAEISNAILQYADDNVNMGQSEIRKLEGDDIFVQEFYDAYLQGGVDLEMWDAPTVNVQNLVEQLDGIQGQNRQNSTLQSAETGGIVDIGKAERAQPETTPKKEHVDNPFDEKGNLLPDVEYESGEFNYTYETDSQGRISHWGTAKLQITSRLKRLRNALNTPGKLLGDHAGHLAADKFGGSSRLDNLVSQLAKVNQSTYRKIEIEWQKAIKAGQNVEVSMDIIYEGDSKRPKKFVVKYSIGSGENIESVTKTINNN